MIKVKKGQDPYSVIGQYIRDHVSAIEDMIAVIDIDGKTSNELFMVDMEVDGYFIWKSDWYEGEENVVLIDFFPVSDACNPKDRWIPCSKKLPEPNQSVLVQLSDNFVETIQIMELDVSNCEGDFFYCWRTQEMGIDFDMDDVVAWMPLPKL